MAKTKSLHSVRFPGESRGYRQARNELLRDEIKLRKQIEKVAALRRQLPLGGEVKQDYVFEEGAVNLVDGDAVRQVRMLDLFEPGKETLVLYNFMYGPRMQHPCPMCTSLLDNLHGSVIHAAQRINFAIVAKSPIHRIRDFARHRGWTNFRILTSANNTYNRDYQGETAGGDQMPVLNVFVSRGEKVFHFYSTELLFMPHEKGQNARHVDLLWPLWNLFDLTPEGRGTDWYPKLSYER